MTPFYELSVLRKAIAYKNLTLASGHVGLSQPQLSRIIQKIESELQVQLLDRSSRRKTFWTQAAYDLADIYFKIEERFTSEASKLTPDKTKTRLKIGTLEGLSLIAAERGQALITTQKISELCVDVYDLTELEALFLSEEVDVILTSRPVGKKKFKHEHRLGSQSLTLYNSQSPHLVASYFEYNKLKAQKLTQFKSRTISNSLMVKKYLIEEYKCQGSVPQEVKKIRDVRDADVILLGQDDLPENLWSELVAPTLRKK